jgi:hypothetical protein
VCDVFPIENDLKQGDAFLTLLYNFALEHAIRKVKENWEEMEFSRTNQPLV